jgi:hypothetical protein
VKWVGFITLCAVVCIAVVGLPRYFRMTDSHDITPAAELLRHDVEAFPAPRLYWIGPRAESFVLVEENSGSEVANKANIRLTYVSHPYILELVTYAGPRRPPHEWDLADRDVPVSRVLMPSGQLVEIAFARGYPRPPRAVIERLKAALRPLTSKDIDALIDDWPDRFSR